MASKPYSEQALGELRRILLGPDFLSEALTQAISDEMRAGRSQLIDEIVTALTPQLRLAVRQALIEELNNPSPEVLDALAVRIQPSAKGRLRRPSRVNHNGQQPPGHAPEGAQATSDNPAAVEGAEALQQSAAEASQAKPAKRQSAWRLLLLSLYLTTLFTLAVFHLSGSNAPVALAVANETSQALANPDQLEVRQAGVAWPASRQVAKAGLDRQPRAGGALQIASFGKVTPNGTPDIAPSPIPTEPSAKTWPTSTATPRPGAMAPATSAPTTLLPTQAPATRAPGSREAPAGQAEHLAAGQPPNRPANRPADDRAESANAPANQGGHEAAQSRRPAAPADAPAAIQDDSTVVSEPSPTPTAAASIVYLTFDDGPNVVWTPQVLAVLAQYGAHATFFVIGQEAAAHPELVEQMVAEGHTVGHHTYSHLDLRGVDQKTFADQVERTSAALGDAVSAYLRPPGGSIDDDTQAYAQNMGLQLVRWNVDTEDWQVTSPETIVAKATSGVRPGSIILLHDGGGDRSATVAALPVILRLLQAQGYVFEAFPPLKAAPEPTAAR